MRVNFQGAINQFIGTTAGTYGLRRHVANQQEQIKLQSPENQLELHKQKLDLERQKNIQAGEEKAQRLEKVAEGMQHATYSGSPEDIADKVEAARSVGDSARENAASEREKLLMLDPTNERAQAAVMARMNINKIQRAREGAAIQAQEEQAMRDQAMEAMKTKGLGQIQQKREYRNFMNYLREQPTSLGGKVGDLPENVQKVIAKQYDKKARKQMMDQMDFEKRGGNK